MPRLVGIPNRVKHYAITLVPVKQEYRNENDLHYMYYCLEKKASLHTEDKVLEYKKDGTPHIHSYVTAKKALFIKPEYFRGFSLRIEPITDHQGWIDYLHKVERKEKNQILFNEINKAMEEEELYYQRHYGFESDPQLDAITRDKRIGLRVDPSEYEPIDAEEPECDTVDASSVHSAKRSGDPRSLAKSVPAMVDTLTSNDEHADT